MRLAMPSLKNIQLTLALVPVLAGSACAPRMAPRLYLPYGHNPVFSDLDKVLKENPLTDGETLKAVLLGQTSEVSHHIVQIRGQEPPHRHKEHDLTATLLSGQGALVVEGERWAMAKGDTVFVPRGALHYYVNLSSAPSAAFVTFSPPFDGKDSVPEEPTPPKENNP